ncbi:MAG: hypothetical protein A2017_03795 [Lentisphaerae bacterium GWF2_44_16]|nr:MAG: hypothetical protein A2017_03795 [Lentisphaerae bacterium GWF2_44_16]
MKKRTKLVFTLLELLIVIAIITILAGLLLPALKSARERTKSISCANQMKQIGTAMHMYENDHNDWIIPVHWTEKGESRTWIQRIYYGDYIKKKSPTFRCPAHTSPVLNYYDSAFEMSYIWSSYMGYWDYTYYDIYCNMKRVANIQNPSRTPAMADGNLIDQYYALWSTSPFDGYSLGSNTSGTKITTSNRHPGNSCNILFVDGHTGNYPYIDLLGYKAQIGWTTNTPPPGVVWGAP